MTPTIPLPAARRAVLALLGRMTTGTLVLTEPDGRTHRFGPGGAPEAAITLRDRRTWAALLRGSRGLAESYADGWWETADLVAVVRVAARNVTGLDELRRRTAAVRTPYQQLAGIRRANTREHARQDIGAHYDLGNELFGAMLDPTMMYSSGFFPTEDATLEEASLAKLELVCHKLGLGPDDHLLEIGTGWGGMAVHAATTRGCRVTTTTISAEQHALAVERVQDAGLSDRVTVLREDYRDLRGRHTKLVSIEMIEAVGWRDFPTFFAKCSDLLTPDGVLLLQAITMDDRAYEVEKASRSFIRTHVFPGGCLPSQEVIARNVARHTDLRTVHHEDLSAHYVTTLAAWRERFEASFDSLRRHGYDERFRRTWRLYLAYCEGGFAERRIGVGQTLLAKPEWRGPVPETAGVGLPDVDAVLQRSAGRPS